MVGVREGDAPFGLHLSSALEPWRTFREGGLLMLLPGPSLPASIQSLHLAACLGKREKNKRKRKEEEIGETKSRKECILSAVWWGVGRHGGRPSLPNQGGNAIFPPTHHSPLGGQSLAKLSTKIKLRCRFLPIALNRADWIRIFLFSSQLDHLGDWGPEERLGPGGGGGRG